MAKYEARLSALEQALSPKDEDLEEAKKKKKKKKKYPFSSLTYTTGNIALNIKRFNQAMGTDYSNPSTEEAKAQKAAEDAAADAAAATTGGTVAGSSDGTLAGDSTTSDGATSDGAGMGESLKELGEDTLFVPKMARAKAAHDDAIQKATVELPQNIHVLPIKDVEAAVKQLSPEEQFVVGYVTPVYFYDELWDKFKLIKCTQVTGYTGMDYRDIRATDIAGTPDPEHDARLAKAKGQIDNPTDADNAFIKQKDKFTKTVGIGKSYADINKTVKQDFAADEIQADGTKKQVIIQNNTILFYPLPGVKPVVHYYINVDPVDTAKGQQHGYFKVDRAILEDTVIKYLKNLMAKGFTHSARWDEMKLAAKIQKTLAADYATQDQSALDQQTVDEPTANWELVDKPQVRALYTGQLFYLKTPHNTLGTPITSLGESLDKPLIEAKREVRRYFLKPQELFCANKAEVIHALISIGDEDCIVYTLLNLGDEKDVTKLTANDIIYYYEDGILYDKNHVKVMDYDLYIKHEEERTKFASVKTISAATFKDEYEDRLTNVTGPLFEEGLEEGIMNTYYSDLKKSLDAGQEVEVGIGHTPVGTYFQPFSDGGYYANTVYTASKKDGAYILRGVDMSDDGDDGMDDESAYVDFEDFVDAISSLDIEDSDPHNEWVPEDHESLNQEFEDFDAFGEKLTESKDDTHTCVICGEEFTGYGNNPAPIKEDGVCCDACNVKFVIPARADLAAAAEDDRRE